LRNGCWFARGVSRAAMPEICQSCGSIRHYHIIDASSNAY
jgi:hypothetical protein